MMTEEKIRQLAFISNCELVQDINAMNLNNLEIKYEIKPAVLAELQEELFDYFKTSTIPELKIVETKFDIFKYDSIDGYGIDAKLFTVDDKETELTLHLEFNNENKHKLKYRSIEVM